MPNHHCQPEQNLPKPGGSVILFNKEKYATKNEEK